MPQPQAHLLNFPEFMNNDLLEFLFSCSSDCEFRRIEIFGELTNLFRSVLFTGVLSYIPLPVLYGVFIYMGIRKVLDFSGNSYFSGNQLSPELDKVR